jgi:drug/metabolite transporter (DMT)-like permease
MALDPSRRLVAVGQALLVTFIWSTSFVVTKWIYALGVQPLTLSGLRYGLAVLLLAPLWWNRRPRAVTTSQPRLPLWLPLLLGLAGYAVNAGGYNIGLFYLDASQVGLLLGMNNTLQVLLWSALLLREWPTRLQGIAIGGALLGVFLFHYPSGLGASGPAGALPVLAAGVGYGLWIVGNRSLLGKTGALDLTWRSMAWGSGALILAALAREGLPRIPATAWGLIVLLAAVNTAFAFTLWTHTQRSLASYESAVINNTMTVQIALLAFFFLAEPLTPVRWAAIVLVSACTLIVHLRQRSPLGKACGRAAAG